MEIKVNIDDYLTKDEIKDECKLAIRQCVFENYRKENDIQRLITNLSYHEVFNMVDDALGSDLNLKEIIKSKVIENINKLASYEIFRDDSYGYKKSLGYSILEDEVEKSRPLIKERVMEIIEKYPFHELDRDEIGDVVYECIMDKLFKDNKDK